MSRPRPRRRSTDHIPAVTIPIDQLPDECVWAACLCDWALIDALGLPRKEELLTDAEGDLLSRHIDLLAAQIHGWIEQVRTRSSAHSA